MNDSLKDYIKIYNVLNYLQCKEILNYVEKFNWHPHKFYNHFNNTEYTRSGDNELEMSWFEENTEQRKILMNSLRQSFLNYVKELNFPWLSGWQGYSDVKLNRYTVDKVMARHYDNITSLFDGTRKGIPTLSAVGLLNDNFSGGEFIMFENTTIELKPGDVVVFPSTFLYPHEILPVTNGIRYSFVSWAW